MDRTDILQLGETIAKTSPNLRVAFNEEDKTADFQSEAAHFIKANGNRVGRDLELYGWMGEKVVGWQGTLPMILEEVLMPIKAEFPDAYRAGSKIMMKWGESVYPDHIAEWKELF